MLNIDFPSLSRHSAELLLHICQTRLFLIASVLGMIGLVLSGRSTCRLGVGRTVLGVSVYTLTKDLATNAMSRITIRANKVDRLES